jgi:hypothetical protein
MMSLIIIDKNYTATSTSNFSIFVGKLATSCLLFIFLLAERMSHEDNDDGRRRRAMNNIIINKNDSSIRNILLTVNYDIMMSQIMLSLIIADSSSH